MKNNIRSNHHLKCIATLALFATAAVAHAQSFLTPIYRGQTGTESAFWNFTFTNNTGGANQAATAAPGGSALANAAVISTAANTILDSGGIYGYPSTNSFVLNYSVLNPASFPDGIGNVVFQTEAAGNPLDYNSIILSFTTPSGTQQLTTTRDEVYNVGGDIVSAWTWNLPVDGVTSFSITFNGAAQHNYLESVMLDVSPFSATPTPEPGTMALAGLGGLGLFFYARRLRTQPAR